MQDADLWNSDLIKKQSRTGQIFHFFNSKHKIPIHQSKYVSYAKLVQMTLQK